MLRAIDALPTLLSLPLPKPYLDTPIAQTPDFGAVARNGQILAITLDLDFIHFQFPTDRF
jgi:hypothetical protein